MKQKFKAFTIKNPVTNELRRGAYLALLAVLLTGLFTACGNKSSDADPGNAMLEEIEGDLTAFSAKTMEGKEFTQENLADYDMTVINIWSTSCGYCIEEMEGLEKFYEQLPDKVNFITICADAGFSMDLATAILEKKGATYETLIGNSSLNDAIMKNVAGTPTTVFVDSKGNLIGSALVGAPCVEDMDRAASLYLKQTESHLQLLES